MDQSNYLKKYMDYSPTKRLLQQNQNQLIQERIAKFELLENITKLEDMFIHIYMKFLLLKLTVQNQNYLMQNMIGLLCFLEIVEGSNY